MGVVPEDLRQLSRDPVDAAGIGPNMKPDDILLRSNFERWEVIKLRFLIDALIVLARAQQNFARH